MINTSNEVKCPLLWEFWIYNFSRRILERVLVRNIVNIRNECLFFCVHGEWIVAREQTNRSRTASRFTRFVCPALPFIPHEPRKKDTHSLIGCCFFGIHVRCGNQKGDEEDIHFTPTREWCGVYLFHHDCLSVCLLKKWFLHYSSIIFWVLTYRDDFMAVAHDPMRTPIGFRVKVQGYTGVWTLHHFAPQLT